MDLFKMIARALGFSRREARILVVGLDNSGKTTLIGHLKPKKAMTSEVTPTVGFQVEEFSKNNINFTVFDMSGQGRYRSLWEHYYRDVQAIIYVLDSSDKLRMCVAKEELAQLLEHEDIKGARIPLLFFANKMDMPGSLTPDMCAEELELARVRDKPWHMIASNALTGGGINEGIEWLCVRLATSDKK
jgi:ADP-ribosylation factor-like protein 6